jgi:hypothetical protein
MLVAKQSGTPTASGSRRFARGLLAVALIFAALVWISFDVWTAPIGLAWHIFHGDSVSFDGRKVRVPWDMRAFQPDDRSVMLIREEPRYAFLRQPYGAILVVRHAGPATDLSKNYDRIAHANEQTKGYRFLDLRRLPGVKGTVSCWESAKLDAPYTSISCYFDKDTLGAAYGGSPEYSDRFYRMLTTIGAISPQAKP